MGKLLVSLWVLLLLTLLFAFVVPVAMPTLWKGQVPSKLDFPATTSPSIISTPQSIVSREDQRDQVVERAAVSRPTSSGTAKDLPIPTPPSARKALQEHQMPQKTAVSLSGPLLVSSAEAGNGVLAESGLSLVEIVALTNLERTSRGIAPLELQSELIAMADAKNRDMIANQYFAHVAPNGDDIAALAKREGYAYLRIGENLALGDFASSSHVVTGWMRSPGHRANILDPEFTQIGVSVMRGLWQGRMVWWVTQEFGRPIPNCPAPDELLRKKITIFDEQLASLRDMLERAKTALETGQFSPDELETKVKEYNSFVDLYNGILMTQREQVARYNEAVTTYNRCIAQ
jgi:uncharacterized protein YkwD